MTNNNIINLFYDIYKQETRSERLDRLIYNLKKVTEVRMSDDNFNDRQNIEMSIKTIDKVNINQFDSIIIICNMKIDSKYESYY